MTITEKISIWQTVFSRLTFLATLLVGFWAWRIGKRQNQISNFVEIFIMPQQVLGEDENGNQKLLYWNLLIKNASSFPVYLNKFSLNGVSHQIGSSAIPSNSDGWHAIPISSDVQKKEELSLDVEFEDYLGKRYKTASYGEFRNNTWNIKSEKRIKIGK